MSITIKIKCHSCEHTFDYYFFQRKWDETIKCPFCYAEMNHQVQKKILDAAGEFADANKDIRNFSLGFQNEPLFQFDLIVTVVDSEIFDRIHGL